MPTALPIVSVTKKEVILHVILNAVELMSVMLPLMTPLQSHDTNASINVIMTEKNVSPYFDHYDRMNAVVPLRTPLICLDIAQTCPDII